MDNKAKARLKHRCYRWRMEGKAGTAAGPRTSGAGRQLSGKVANLIRPYTCRWRFGLILLDL